MRWESIEAFIRMGGYGLYVWTSYGMCIIALGIEYILESAKNSSIDGKKEYQE
jgi:heme exporter protein D